MKYISVTALMLLCLAIGQPGLAGSPSAAPVSPFKTLAGSWGWEGSDTVGCSSNPHTIAFPDAKTATFTFAKPFKSASGATTNVSTYDVLYDEDNKITMYLRGETRRTDLGDRVIWVLIVKNPTTYAWRRTDWPADHMTKNIVRC